MTKRNTAQKVIALTGATGFLGTNLTNHLLAQGYDVVGLVRNATSRRTQPGLSFREYALEAPLDKKLLDGVDYLVHAAYTKYSAAQPDALDVNVTAAQRLRDASRQQGVTHSIFISTMSAHNEATSVYGKQKLAIEAIFSDDSSTVLKCGLIIGKGGIVADMAQFMKTKHAVPLIGGGKQPLQIVAVSDLLQVIESNLKNGRVGNYVVATPQVYTYKEFYAALAKQLRVKIVYVPVPYGVLKAAFRAAALLRLPLGVGEDNLEGLKMLKSMDSKADLQTLGVQLMDLKTALKKSGI